MEKKLLLFLDPEEVNDADKRQLKHLLGGMQIVVTRNSRTINTLLPHIVIAAGWLTPEIVNRMPNVKWVHHWAAGVDGFTE